MYHKGKFFNGSEIFFDTCSGDDVSLGNLGNFHINGLESIIIYWIGIESIDSSDRVEIEYEDTEGIVP